MFPLHFLYLAVFTKEAPSAVWAGLLYALNQHIVPTRFDKAYTFPRWGFLRLATILAMAMAVPALLWFIAVMLAP